MRAHEAEHTACGRLRPNVCGAERLGRAQNRENAFFGFSAAGLAAAGFGFGFGRGCVLAPAPAPGIGVALAGSVTLRALDAPARSAARSGR